MITLTFHVEDLHDNASWQRLLPVAQWMARHGMMATFFVFPFRAQMAHKDIRDRVSTISSMGHEIGQHTHFYKGEKINKPDKANDFSKENVSLCLARDFEILRAMGFQPKCFTAGAWVINEIILGALIELGFSYDCSARFPKPIGKTESPYYKWITSPYTYTDKRGNIICLPTTCSLGEWFKWGRRVRVDGQLPYQLVYLHDYDLVSIKNYLLLWVFLRLNRKKSFLPVGALAKQLHAAGYCND